MSADLHCEFTDRPQADELGAVDAGLHRYNLASADLSAVKPLACFARTSAGAVVGGLRARQWGRAVEVQQLWVEQSRRRQGIAARLMQLLDVEVRRRGASLIYLDTFSFQAPKFYERCGFSVAVRLDGMPGGIEKYVMIKRLDEAAGR